uniref:Translation initiation factor eIF2B subunit delta n=1 Tax=Blastobotrys adeninivorans TaxID=409370 RepID=A0A060T2U5_BLAAD
MSEQQLSAKELKAKRRAEKVKQRAAAQGQAAPVPGKPAQNQKGGPKQLLQQQQQPLVPAERRMALFNHLETHGKSTTAQAPKEVHPAVLSLALQYSEYKVLGSTDRCKAMLEAFKQVIRDYTTPSGTTLSRNLTTVLSHQIDFLKSARPLSISMGNSIRWLKQEISKVSIDVSEPVAKTGLIEAIDSFVRDRIDIADQVIVSSAVQSIEDDAVILTYARSSVVQQTLIKAHEEGKKFRVIVVDSRPLFEGKKAAKELAEHGIRCTYVLLTALPYVIKEVTTVFLGAHAMVSNGLLYSRVGTAMVATAAKSRNIPVVVLCESIKFADRVQLDSVTFNELSSPDLLTDLSKDPENKRVPSEALKDWRDEPNLGVLSILYDLSPVGTIKKVITELGSLPASSVPVVLREYKASI